MSQRSYCLTRHCNTEAAEDLRLGSIAGQNLAEQRVEVRANGRRVENPQVGPVGISAGGSGISILSR